MADSMILAAVVAAHAVGNVAIPDQEVALRQYDERPGFERAGFIVDTNVREGVRHR